MVHFLSSFSFSFYPESNVPPRSFPFLPPKTLMFLLLLPVIRVLPQIPTSPVPQRVLSHSEHSTHITHRYRIDSTLFGIYRNTKNLGEKGPTLQPTSHPFKKLQTITILMIHNSEPKEQLGILRDSAGFLRPFS